MDGRVLFYICIIYQHIIVSTQNMFVEESTNFQFSKCEQSLEGITCQTLNFTKGSRGKPSLWPPGPYAIPISDYGCPESKSRGWSMSYLKIKKNGTAVGRKMKTLRFCVKLRNDNVLDTENWIQGNYSIYRIGDECPKGFKGRTLETHYNNYESYGSIPNITASETLSIAMCDKINDMEVNGTFRMLDTFFSLRKKEASTCPKIPSVKVRSRRFCDNDPVGNTVVKSNKTAHLVKHFDLSWGISPKCKDIQELYCDWYQIDLRRSMQVSRIEMINNDIKNEGINFQLTQCHHSEVKMYFPFKNAMRCKYSRAIKPLTVLLSHVRARFLFLSFQVFTSRQESQLLYRESLKIYITDLESLDGELCNEDLGMRNGGIQDYQIFASSASEHYPPNAARPSAAGWCIDISKDAYPWIMVDLISITKIEGLTIFANTQGEHAHSTVNWDSFQLLYGNTTSNLTTYMFDEKFKTHLDNKSHQTFLLQIGFITRFVKLEMIESKIKKGQACLRFEIHGCKMSGIPISSACVIKLVSNNNVTSTYHGDHDSHHDHHDSYYDHHESQHMDQESEHNGPDSHKEIDKYNHLDNENVYNDTTSDDYYSHFGEDSSENVALYENIFYTSEDNKTGPSVTEETTDSIANYFTPDICNGDQLELFPSFSHSYATIISNVLYIHNSTVIMSTGYPYLSGNNYDYTWVIDFEDQRYVRIVFTNVELNQMAANDDNDDCNDTLLIGTQLKQGKKGMIINSRYNKRVFIVETNNSIIVITFQLCHYKFKGSKFRAVVSEEDVPACLSIGSNVDWSKGREELCTQPEMILTSMSLLNIPFETNNERFVILAQTHHNIEIEFEDFYVVCPFYKSDIRSLFTITERNGEKENSYCNTRKPPIQIKSEEREMVIEFRRYENPSEEYYGREGFRLKYTTRNYALKSWTTTKDYHDINGQNFSSVCSKEFGKCYNIFSSSMSWFDVAKVCLKYDQNLVTVHSQKELRYINYIVRDQRYNDEANEKIKDSNGFSYSAHIGLKNEKISATKKKYVWMNSYEVIFSAWAISQPSTGDCTRTNVRSFGTDRTWESEDCNNGRAQYFICQTEYKEEIEVKSLMTKDECKTLYKHNRLKIKQSYSGKKCQNWSKLSENAKDHFMKTFNKHRDILKLDNDMCEDPLNIGIIGCYVNDSVMPWEPCFFSLLETETASVTSEQSIGDHFICKSTRSVIPSNNRCDRSFDCEDGSDEIQCIMNEHDLTRDRKTLSSTRSITLTEGLYLQCGSKEWISIKAKCDTLIDCLDASDEFNCSRNVTGCNKTEFFQCSDGSCIKFAQVCDFYPDCTNAEDEFCDFQTCRFDEYICDNKQCIPENMSCDSIPHCLDGSDEVGCTSCQNSFLCDNDKCISYILVCDKVRDFNDGTDESDCTSVSASTCEDWWKKGYHESGQYSLGNFEVYCGFNWEGDASIQYIMEIRNLDLVLDVLYTTTSKTNYLDINTFINELLLDDSVCEYDIKSMCHLPESIALMYDKKYNGSMCQCSIQTVGLNRYDDYYYIDEDLNYGDYDHFNFDRLGRRRRSLYGDYYDNDKIISDNVWSMKTSTEQQFYSCEDNGVAVRSDLIYYKVNMLNNEIQVNKSVTKRMVPVDIRIDKISCTPRTFMNDTYDCVGDNTTINKSQICIYDKDAAGYMTGCRSGIHLQNCEDFICPKSTVKCPDSYCLHLRFVCDGQLQCPGGQDELNCSCVDTSREVIFLIEDTGQATYSLKAAKLFAKQFISEKSIVRLLYFEGKSRFDDFPLKHRLLNIREKYIGDIKDVTSDCTYSIMARNFLPSLRFSNKETKAVIFIEDSEESSTVAEIMFTNIPRQSFTIYRVIRNTRDIFNMTGTYEFVKDVYINTWSILHSVGYRLFPEICKEASHVPCVDGFRCHSSKQCIPLDQVCDGVAQCINRDDEYMCDFTCHQKCRCGDGDVKCRDTNLNISDIHFLPRTIRSADLSHNPGIKDVLSTENLHFSFLFILDVSNCNIEIISKKAFVDINNLIILNISHNSIKRLSQNVFKDLRYLIELDLDGNLELTEIAPTTFQGLRSIKTLRIIGTKLKKISSLTFSNLTLESIDISNNQIHEIEDYAFRNTSVKKINIEGNVIVEFHQFIFKDVVSLNELRTPAYKFCCIRPCYVEENNCYPSKNEFSSCGDLMRHPVLQAVLWLVGLASLLGNLGSIFYRLVYDRQRLRIGYGIFVTNLASADLLMGIYLIAIAFVDSIYRGRYIYMDDQWRNSIWCTLAGFLSTVSSEASVFFLCLITIDRLLVIKYPFGHVRFTPRRAHVCCFMCWMFAIALAAFPIFYTDYFNNSFYSRSGVCIALPLSNDKPPGWIYSVSIFVGLNFSTFILVAFGQLSIFLELRKSAIGGKKTQKSRKRDLQVAKNLILVATTDFLCRFPIGLMGIMTLNGYTISGDVYAWTAVFILPFNSALNPFLYTLSAIIGKKSFNPSVEEQSRTEVQKEMGSAILQYMKCSRSVRIRDGCSVGKAKSIDDILKGDEILSAGNVTAISYQLANYLRVLHESSICIEKLSETNTFIRNRKKNAKRPVIVIDSKSTLMTDERKKADNVYQFGCLLRKMITKCKATD